MIERLRKWREKRRMDAEWRVVSADVRQAKQHRVDAILAADQGDTVETLEELLFRHDPIGINFEENTDEYQPEAETITLRRGEVHSVEDARRVVHEEFVRWFDLSTAGPPERYDAIAREIWALWSDDRSRGGRERPSRS